MPVVETKTQQALSIQDLAKQLSVSVRTASRLIAGGDLRAHRIGRQWRVLGTDLQDYLARHINQQAADRRKYEPTELKPAGLGSGGETEAKIEPQRIRSTGREPTTINRFNALLAESVLGWGVSPERFLVGNRQWIPRSSFQPFQRVQDAFKLLHNAASVFSLIKTADNVFSATVQVGGRTGTASGAHISATISRAVASAIGLDVSACD